MGWFSRHENRAEDTSDPSRENRQKCWETRDVYFACLDGARIVKPGQEGGSTCGQERMTYYGSCAKSWVEYFNQRRVIADAQKERLGRVNDQLQKSQQ